MWASFPGVCRLTSFLAPCQHYSTVAPLIMWDTGNNSPLRLTSAALSQVQQQQQQSRSVGTPVSESFYSGELSGVYCASTYFVSQCARFASNLRRQKQHVHCPASLLYTHLHMCALPFTRRYGLRQPSPAGREGDGGGRLPGGQGEDWHADGEEERRHQAAPFVRGEWQTV
jgi:hypothetical protein